MTTLVAGAGLAGLVAAARLAERGHRVRVWDPAPPGGRARSLERGGAWVNLGPHALYLRGPAARILSELGVSWSGGQPRRGMFMTRDNAIMPLPMNPLSLLTSSAMRFRARWLVGRRLATLPSTSWRGLRPISVWTC